MIVKKQYKIDDLTTDVVNTLDKTKVFKSSDSPTGYLVSFRLRAPDLEHLSLAGDWMFSDTYHSSHYRSGRYWPHQWKPDFFPHMLLGLLKKPEIIKNSSSKDVDPKLFEFDWDVLKLGIYEMNKDKETGIFSCTIPLPSGVFNYRFIIDMPDGNPLSINSIPDPNNLSAYDGANQTFSQVYLPFDRKRQKIDRSIELADSRFEKGKVIYDTYHADPGYNLEDNQPLRIYLPPSYEKISGKKYPVLYLSHGGGGNENDWFNQGALENMLNQLIGLNQVEPMIVVAMNNERFKWNNFDVCIPNLMEHIIPFIESKYLVRKDPHGRAFAGLSAGGLLAFDLFSQHPDQFSYFGIWSGGQRGPVNFKAKGFEFPEIHIGAGRYDDAAYDHSFNLEDTCYKNNIRFTSFFPEGGHQWSAWRRIFEDFAGRVLWKKT